jgi:ribosomal protein L32
MNVCPTCGRSSLRHRSNPSLGNRCLPNYRGGSFSVRLTPKIGNDPR